MYELMKEIKDLKRRNEFFIKHSKSYLENTKVYFNGCEGGYEGVIDIVLQWYGISLC